MMISDYAGNSITVEPGDGEHSVTVMVREHGTPAAMLLRPDDAVALGSLLLTWARERSRAEGLF